MSEQQTKPPKLDPRLREPAEIDEANRLTKKLVTILLEEATSSVIAVDVATTVLALITHRVRKPGITLQRYIDDMSASVADKLRILDDAQQSHEADPN